MYFVLPGEDKNPFERTFFPAYYISKNKKEKNLLVSR